MLNLRRLLAVANRSSTTSGSVFAARRFASDQQGSGERVASAFRRKEKKKGKGEGAEVRESESFTE
jgi:hypothetical protein